jgi:hypothetical protein
VGGRLGSGTSSARTGASLSDASAPRPSTAVSSSQSSSNTSSRIADSLGRGSAAQHPLNAVHAPTAPASLRHLSAVQALRQTWIAHYRQSEGQVRLRQPKAMPPAPTARESPDEPEARYGYKRGQTWQGYKVHLTETCDDEQRSHLLTNVATTIATASDMAELTAIHEGLARVDWDQHVVYCPRGRPSAGWYPAHMPHGQPVIQVTFAMADCTSCPSASSARAPRPTTRTDPPLTCRVRGHAGGATAPGTLPWTPQDPPASRRHRRGDQPQPSHHVADWRPTRSHPLLTVRGPGFRQTRRSTRPTLTSPTESCD